MNRQNILISVVSGTLSISGYILLRKLLCSGRKCKNVKTNQTQSKIYEEKSLLDQYMMFNFSDSNEIFLFDDLNECTDVTNCFLFPKRVALLFKEYCPDIFSSSQVFNYLIFIVIKFIFFFLKKRISLKLL